MAHDEHEKPKRGLTQRITEKAAAGLKGGVAAVQGMFQTAKRAAFDAFARFTEDGKEIDFPIDFEADTVWSTQDQMAELFGVDRSVISKHLKTLFDDGELDRDSVCAKFARTAADGKTYDVSHYSLDAILAVGFKVSSRKALAFRKWANKVLKGYIEKGYALNGKRLDQDPAALLALSREVRAIRTSEKNIYEQVREAFVQCAIDYDKDDPAARTFFFTSQDVFHYAASGQTALQIIQSRADASKPQMGLTQLGNQLPDGKHVTTAKNYCTKAELRKMELIGEAWLLYAEGMAMQGKQISMQRLLDKLRDLVTQYEFPVFRGYDGVGLRRDAVHRHAKAQLELFKQSTKKLPPTSAA